MPTAAAAGPGCARRSTIAALADFDAALRLDPKSAFAMNARGLIRSNMQDDDRALADFDRAIHLDPKLASAYLNRGGLRRDRGSGPRRSPISTRPCRLDARDPYAHYHHGFVLFATRRGGAADEAKAALDLQGWRGDLSMYAGLLGHFAARRDGRPDRARSLLDEAATRCETSAWPYPIIKHLRGELDEAALLAAAADDGKQVEARCYLGLEALEDGRERRGHRAFPRGRGAEEPAGHAVRAERRRAGPPAGPGCRRGRTVRCSLRAYTSSWPRSLAGCSASTEPAWACHSVLTEHPTSGHRGSSYTVSVRR